MIILQYIHNYKQQIFEYPYDKYLHNTILSPLNVDAETWPINLSQNNIPKNHFNTEFWSNKQTLIILSRKSQQKITFVLHSPLKNTIRWIIQNPFPLKAILLPLFGYMVQTSPIVNRYNYLPSSALDPVELCLNVCIPLCLLFNKP